MTRPDRLNRPESSSAGRPGRDLDVDGVSTIAAAAGVHCLQVPTPFAIGSVNAYVIEDEPLTLIDSGPASTESLEAVVKGLRALGHDLTDLGLLVVTHQHVDHFGLTSYLAAASGAEVACSDSLAVYAETFEEAAAADDHFAAELMLLHGVPADTVAVLQRVSSLARRWGTRFTPTRSLGSGSSIELHDRSLRVISAPGHSPTDTLFLDETRGMLFSGDHLLAKISSNALVSRDTEVLPKNGNSPRRRPLLEYIDSLRSTRELEVAFVLGGHGPPIPDHRAAIDSQLAHYEQRAEHILSIVRQQRRSAHEIAELIWGKVAITQAFLTLSEVLGHIDLLIDRGLVTEDQPSTGPVGFIGTGA
jgi:glyoxylase-like metal-dependent hydrolase (beta-lactamase superfamily II)